MSYCATVFVSDFDFAYTLLLAMPVIENKNITTIVKVIALCTKRLENDNIKAVARTLVIFGVLPDLWVKLKLIYSAVVKPHYNKCSKTQEIPLHLQMEITSLIT